MTFIELNQNECRILGVLVEKALTTPGQYPLTLNGMVTGSNQRSNRNPTLNLDEDDVITAVDGLRAKQLAREVIMSGSRVAKYRHLAREGFGMETPELVVLVELLLRGPQSVGELRGRASRMYALDSLETVNEILDGLMQRDPPMVRRIAPAPGSRAARFVQLLCPSLHPVDMKAPAPASTEVAAPAPAPPPRSNEQFEALEARVETLEATVARIEAALGGPE